MSDHITVTRRLPATDRYRGMIECKVEIPGKEPRFCQINEDSPQAETMLREHAAKRKGEMCHE